MTKHHALKATGWLAALGCLLPLGAAAQTATATLVCKVCWISGISADGKSATGQMNDNYETFLWKRGSAAQRLGRSTVDVLGVSGGWPAISADGQTIASSILSDDGTLMTSGIWSNGVWSQIGPLPDDVGSGDSQDSAVWAMSGDGKTVAGLYWRYGQTGGLAHPYTWKAGTQMIDLGTSGGSGRINGASHDGSVMAGWQEDVGTGSWAATVWVNGQRTQLGAPGGFGMAQAVSPDGAYVVGQDSNPKNGRAEAAMWHWNGSSWDRTSLGVLKGTVSGDAYANGVSADGKVVVGFGKKEWGPGGAIGWVWTQKRGRMVPAKAFFAEFGYNDPEFDIGWVMAVSPDARSFAVVETMIKQPFMQRSKVIRLSSAAQ